MNKLLRIGFTLAALAIAATLVCYAASAPSSDQRTKLAESTANGVTKTLYVGRAQTDPSPDGTINLTVYPDEVLTDSEGNVLARGFKAPFTVVLTQQQAAAVLAIIKASYDAQQAAQ